jgi:hypothetical protein
VRYGAFKDKGPEQPLGRPDDSPPAAELPHSSNHAAVFLTLCDQRLRLGPRSAKRPMYGDGSLVDGSLPAYFFADIGSSPHEHIGVPIAFRC